MRQLAYYKTNFEKRMYTEKSALICGAYRSKCDRVVKFGRNHFNSTGVPFAIIENALNSNSWCKASKFSGQENHLLVKYFFTFIISQLVSL